MGLIIEDGVDTFDKYIGRESIDHDLRKNLFSAGILILPFDDIKGKIGKPLFPNGTEDILAYFKKKLPQEQIIDICIADDDYQEFAFYNDYKRLGKFMVKSAVLPLFISILSSYIYDNYVKVDNSKPEIHTIDQSTNTTNNNYISTITGQEYLEPPHIQFSVTIVDTLGKSKNITYEGPAKELDNILKTFKEYEEEGNHGNTK